MPTFAQSCSTTFELPLGPGVEQGAGVPRM